MYNFFIQTVLLLNVEDDELPRTKVTIKRKFDYDE